MANKISTKQLALTLGVLAGAIHFIWIIIIGLFATTVQSTLNWIFLLHLLEPVYIITEFSWINLIILTLLGFVSGYISGYIIAGVYNWAGKCCKN